MAELIWAGKYDAAGARTAPRREALPMRDLEIVGETGAVTDDPARWRNLLIWGDKDLVLPSLLPEFAGRVNLIYIDPPFATGAEFTYTARFHDVPPDSHEAAPGSRTRSRSIRRTAYRDAWGRGLDGYLRWFSDTAVLLHELLAADGSLYVHADWRAVHYLRTVLDEIFAGGFRNEIIWSYGGRGAKAVAGQFPRNHDTILLYAKSPRPRFNPITGERRIRLDQVTAAGFRVDGDGRIFKTAPRGDYTDASIERLRRDGRVHTTSNGNVRVKYFLRRDGDDAVEDRLLGDVWSDIPDAMHLPRLERTGYPTQKPEALLDRIIRASSYEGDLVLDCFAGSGTTAVVAQKLGRRWIAADAGRLAIHATRRRLLSLSTACIFVLRRVEASMEDDAPTMEPPQPACSGILDLRVSILPEAPRTVRVCLHGLRRTLSNDVPGSVDHWTQLVDSWAIDWDYRGEAFRNRWCAIRTTRRPTLDLVADHAYPESGTYVLLVTVTDILGGETTGRATVEIKPDTSL